MSSSPTRPTEACASRSPNAASRWQRDAERVAGHEHGHARPSIDAEPDLGSPEVPAGDETMKLPTRSGERSLWRAAAPQAYAGSPTRAGGCVRVHDVAGVHGVAAVPAVAAAAAVAGPAGSIARATAVARVVRVAHPRVAGAVAARRRSAREENARQGQAAPHATGSTPAARALRARSRGRPARPGAASRPGRVPGLAARRAARTRSAGNGRSRCRSCSPCSRGSETVPVPAA